MITLFIMDENRAEGEFLLRGPGKAALAALLFLLASAFTGRGVDHGEAFRKLPTGREILYQPSTYAACIPCHPRVVFEDEDFNVATHFRDTRRGKNLHWMHVFRQPRGTNCSSCHRADDNTGTLEYPAAIRFEQLPDGGACAPACHRPKQYRNAGRAAR